MSGNEQDYDLVKRFINGEEIAFNLLVNKYRKKIYEVARRMMGNHLDADEVVQEVLIVLYSRLKDFQFRSSLYTWIYRIVITRSLNMIKKRTIRHFFSMNSKEIKEVAYNPGIEKNIENKDKISKLEGILQKLPPKQREVFILRNFEELAYEEISEITGKSIGALKANYFHASNKIIEMMEHYD